ncbi:hypothetical protein [Idiomarina abyssalis]|uniref:hypothetical protein n=1 Tax=Idiomarina abyssalis TaxID=86102 RepID=UPI003A902A29
MTSLAELPLWQRLEVARQYLKPVQSDYRVVFETDLDGSACILVPDPNWLACALYGGILPPVEVYHDLDIDENGRVLNGHILHETAPVGPMTEEEAIEYLIKKDVPAHVWQDNRGNRPKFVICHKTQLPQDREFRNAWALKEVS